MSAPDIPDRTRTKRSYLGLEQLGARHLGAPHSQVSACTKGIKTPLGLAVAADHVRHSALELLHVVLLRLAPPDARQRHIARTHRQIVHADNTDRPEADTADREREQRVQREAARAGSARGGGPWSCAAPPQASRACPQPQHVSTSRPSAGAVRLEGERDLSLAPSSSLFATLPPPHATLSPSPRLACPPLLTALTCRRRASSSSPARP